MALDPSAEDDAVGQRILVDGLMQGFDLSQAIGLQQIEGTHFTEALARLLAAFVLGSFVAFRPWRHLIRNAPETRIETAHVQILIAVAGALVIAVIGDNMARAFGLVGLGGFIRFRSGIKDPRDAAIMFVMIGLGMACGLGVVPVAAACAAFTSAVLFIFDLSSVGRPRRMRVGMSVEDPRVVLPALKRIFPLSRVMSAPAVMGEKNRIQLEMDVPAGADATTLIHKLQDSGVTGVRELWIEDE